MWQADISSIREAYDGFLAEFPLCYVYWKRYADHEAAAGSAQDKVSEVYERSVEAFPHSVDLWTYYCTYLAERLADPTLVRRFALPLRQNLARCLISIHACSIPFSIKISFICGVADRLVGTPSR